MTPVRRRATRARLLIAARREEVGRAPASGIGFGSPNIVNKSISGLILLAGRPIRVGDSAA